MQPRTYFARGAQTNGSAGGRELAGLAVAETSSGQNYLFGDPLNEPLVDAKISLWALAAGRAQSRGCKEIPDVGEIFKHVAASVGDATFGVPRLPNGHPVHELPLVYLQRLWFRFAPVAERFCPRSEDRPLLYALAIQDLMTQTKSALDPCIALKIVMESAIPMSKVFLSVTRSPE